MNRWWMGAALAVGLILPTPTWATEPALKELGAAVRHDAWPTISRIKFTWEHVPRAIKRSYDWDLSTGKVVVTIDGQPVTVPASGVGLVGPDQEAAHKAFINDSYWLLFEHRVQDDKVTVASERTQPAAVDPKNHGISVQYPSQGGYTPGDRYVLWIGLDGRPTHWENFPGGEPVAKFLISRTDWVEKGGIWVPMRFVKDGQDFIRITDLDVVVKAARPQ